MPTQTARQPLRPAQSTPQLNIYDPAGNPIKPKPDVLREVDKMSIKDISPPMFRCGNNLCIVSGDDVFPLPKEMDVSHWGADNAGLFNYQQVPASSWPPRLSVQSLNVDKKEDGEDMTDGDFEPMEVFQVHPEVSPPTPKRSFLDSVAVDEDQDMSEFIQTQETVASSTLDDGENSPETSSQESDDSGIPPLVTQEESLTFTTSVSLDMSSSLPHCTSCLSTSSTVPLSMTPSLQETELDGGLADAGVSLDMSLISTSEVASLISGDEYSQTTDQQSQITIPTDALREASSQPISEEPPHHDTNLGKVTSAEGGLTDDEEAFTQSTKHHDLVAQIPTMIDNTDISSPLSEADVVDTHKTPSSQDSVVTDQSADASTSTGDDPRIVTPDLSSQSDKTSSSDVPMEDNDSCHTPPLSPDEDDSMIADTSIETVDADVITFYNGDIGRNSPEDFFTAKTTSETDEDSSPDEEVALVPRLLTYAVPTPKLKRKIPHRQDLSLEVVNDKAVVVEDPFSPVKKSTQPEPKTPRRGRKTQPIRCKGSIEPPRLFSAFKSSPSYKPPQPRARPFFPCQISDIRRSAFMEPSSSTIFPDASRGSHDPAMTGTTPSRPLFLLANAATDAATGDGNQPKNPTPWVRSCTLTEQGSQAAGNSFGSFPTFSTNHDGLGAQAPSLTTAPSPSEMIWQKGHVRPATTPSGKGRRLFVPPMPLSRGETTTLEDDSKSRSSIPKIAAPAAKSRKFWQSKSNRPGPSVRRGAEQSTDSISSHVETPLSSKKARQLPPMAEVWDRSMEQEQPILKQATALRPHLRAGFENAPEHEKETVELRDVSNERSPSPVEEETLGSIIPIEFEAPVESLETVSSTDSGLMGRAFAPSSPLTPADKAVDLPAVPPQSIATRGRGSGRPRGSGRGRGGGRGRGMVRAASSIGRAPAPPARSATLGAKRRQDVLEELPEMPPPKKMKVSGRSKTLAVAPPPQPIPAPVTEAPVQAPIVISSSPRVSPTKHSRPPRSRSSPHKYGMHVTPKAVLARENSPDPIGLSPAKALEVKREAVEEIHANAEAGSSKPLNPRFYTDPEIAIILNTLGPDKTAWIKTKAKCEEICENLKAAGHRIRSVGAMKFKVAELIRGN